MDPVTPGPGLGAVVQMLLALAAIVGLLLGGSRLLQRLRLVPARQGGVKVLAVQPLGVRCQLVMVEVEGEKLLLGVTPQQITRVWNRPGFSSVLEAEETA